MVDQIVRVSKINLQCISEASDLQKEIDAKGYILRSVFGARSHLVLTYGSEEVDQIDNHFRTFER